MGDLLFAPFAGMAVGERNQEADLQERERLWQRVWCECPGIGWRRLQGLRHHFSSLEQAWSADGRDLRSATGLGPKGLATLEAYRQRWGQTPLPQPLTPAARLQWRRRRCLLPDDPALPDSIRTLERPPLQLYWQGNGTLWPHLRQQQAIAVVGTRRPSRHGEVMARAIGQALAEAGWPVVSGLAEGIDAAAHAGCLERHGRPVAVLGTPLERVYPRHHGDLQQRVARQGLLISELPAGAAVQPGHFAARNRLQVALAKAVVVVECPTASGALHSARLAWDHGLPVWVVPADAGKVSASGSNRLLLQGATALLDPADLIRDLGPGPLLHQGQQSSPPTPAAPGSLELREAALLAALGRGASLEQLCERLRQTPGVLSKRLLQLELAGLLRAEPGLWWRPC
jgi:DNA processing protein